ncbi:MAG: DMT family transporter [Magnetococcales bacterium]|nr:DMT family transporter [Magnetococcales bacterium]MBF0151337.1 DMT family transporter [Magnetococcales bacterium]MBF0174751.1 DMT family transporter [Magnetococcales bacterium]MBF0631757.1 DMT family transporter [Magnetococcales bacterium]
MIRLQRGRFAAVLLVLLAGSGFSMVAAVVKAVSANLHPFQLVFLRTFFGMLWVSPFLIRRGVGLTLVSDHPGLHFLRAMAGIIAMGSAFYAYSSTLSLALVTAISFTTPLWVIGLAWPVLGERVRWSTGLATLAGFAGVLIMSPPGWGGLDLAWTAALCSPFFEAVVLVLVKRLTATEPILNIIATYSVFSVLFWLPVAVWVWQPIGSHDLSLMIGVAGVATISQAATINAYAMAPATFITPFYYIRLVFIVVIGFISFQEVPVWTTWLGALVIIGSNIAIVKYKG